MHNNLNDNFETKDTMLFESRYRCSRQNRKEQNSSSFSHLILHQKLLEKYYFYSFKNEN